MILEVRHRTRFGYSRPVFLDPLTVRLRPRSDCTQNVLAHTLRVTPEPAGSAESVELDGASSATLWFAGRHDRLEIEAWSRVETLRANPFDFIVTDPGVYRVPACYARETEAALAPYLRRRDPSAEGEEMARQAAADAGGDTSAFLLLLARRLPERVTPMTREHGAPWSPDRTLAEGRGACRDLTILYMDMCRSLGLAARFVSGYRLDDPDREDRHLHAWAEIYLPGGGWRGFDLNEGHAVAEDHVATAAAAEPAGAAPTQGTFRIADGSEELLRTSLDYKIEMSVVGRSLAAV